jgi:hypothetical protein
MHDRLRLDSASDKNGKYGGGKKRGVFHDFIVLKAWVLGAHDCVLLLERSELAPGCRGMKKNFQH